MNPTSEKRTLTVGVMRGGPSSEYEVSLKTGANVMNELRGRHNVRDIFIDREGNWHIDGVSRSPERILPQVDVIFNALHGTYGEDGRVQSILDAHGKPYTGSGALASAIGMNKALAKKFYRDHNIQTPRGVVIRPHAYDEHTLSSILEDFHGAAIVKPVSAGSSIGISVARDPRGFEQAIHAALSHSPEALVEEYLFGREATVAVVEGSEPGQVYTLPVIEIRNTSADKDIWNYDSKYSDDLHELVVPGNFTVEESIALENAAMRAHKALGLSHYSRSDFMVTPSGIYILETNTLPGMTSASLLPHALKAAGIKVSEFLDHVLDLAMRR